ncbi:3-methyl-2-oxobutanoate dehydrogenase subunit VorB [bacterium]|nr:3-methyl-2-oxobutanoate dehydrogenase subunit VorB [bacterium]
MKGNEALAEASIRAGLDAYFGYPITPQSEILEYFSRELPKKGIAFVQAESEVASINMVYGAAGCGKRVMTSTSSPGFSLMMEGVSYIACAELPCVLVNVQRGGPGLGTIQPSQGDYFQAVKGGGHGDYHMIVLAPNSVQEMADMPSIGFELAEKYRIPVLILADGALGQMMEKVEFKEYPKKNIEQNWATVGKPEKRDANVITSLFIESEVMEQVNIKLQKKYEQITEEVEDCELYHADDAEVFIVAYGISSRLAKKAVDLSREKGVRAGLIRPKILWPFPTKVIQKYATQAKGFISLEMSAGQMIEDVKLSLDGSVKSKHYGRMGGMIPAPEDILKEIESML